MSQSDRGGFRDDVRAASEVLGVVLLVGMVFLGAWLVVVYGSSIVDSVRDQNDKQTATLVVQELDSRLGTLAQLNDVGRIRFDVGNTDPDDLRIEKSGYINITVNRPPGVADYDAVCHSSVNLTSIRYQDREGRTVAYEAGGVWETASRGADGSAMLTAPDVNFRDGSLDVTVVNVTGTIQESVNEATLEVEASREGSTELTKTVLDPDHDCIRPDNVTLKIKSDFYRAWGDYLQSEIGSDYEVETYSGNKTAMVYLPQDALPRSADDARNHVVNMSNASYMRHVYIGGNPVDGSQNIFDGGNNITIDKEAGNTYQVAIRPLTDERLDIGKRKNIPNSQTVYGKPVDVVFVLDDSGSMSNGGSPDKLLQAQRAAANSLTSLTSDRSRAGIVGFDTDSEYYPTDSDSASPRDLDGEYLSTQFGDGWAAFAEYDSSVYGVNGSLDALNHGGGTRMDRGLRKAYHLLNTQSNQTRNRTVILLSDGNNNPESADEPTKELAKKMGREGITVYTIGFGSGADTSLLTTVANNGGGEYYSASDSDQLEDVFNSILTQASQSQQIAKTPLTTNATSSNGQNYAPFIPGDTDEVVRTNYGGEEYVNINDPMAPSSFRQSFSLKDGESAIINATWYQCADDPADPDSAPEWEGTPFTETVGGTTYQVTRCAYYEEDDGTKLTDSDVSVYLDGTDMSSSGADLLKNDSASWQQNMTNTLGPYLNDTTKELELDSNQAVVIYDFPDGPDSNNKLVTLYEIGLSEEEAQSDGIINIRVRDVTISDGN